MTLQNPTDPNQTLLPCPFCGKQPKTEMINGRMAIFCHDDACPVALDVWVEDSISAWNTRAPSAELTQAQALVDRLAGVLDGARSFFHEAGIPCQQIESVLAEVAK